jgi:hypothetical protein
MSFGLGFWAAAGGPSVPTDYEQIATVFPNGSLSSVVFSSIPQGFKHLQIRYAVRNNETFDAVRGFFLHLAPEPTDAGLGNIYRSHMLLGNGSTVTSTATAADFRIIQDFVPTANSTANSFGVGVIDILDYATTSKNKTVRWFAGSLISSSNRVALISGARYLTDAVSTLQMYSNGAFVNGSRVSLYGIKG